MDFQKIFEIKKVAKNLKKNSQFREKNNYAQSCYLFTDSKKIEDLNQVLKKMPRGSNIIFREYNLEPQDRLCLAQKLLPVIKYFNHKILVGKDFEIARKIKAQGLHFADKDLIKKHDKIFSTNYNLWQIRSICRRKNMIFSIALHNLKYLNHIKKLQPDIIFLSPVFASSSHKNQGFIGLFQFIKMVKIILRKTSPNYLNNIIPLGGINLHNLRRLNNFGIAKFGAIDFFNKS
jgi:thiamine monophosphate synthase